MYCGVLRIDECQISWRETRNKVHSAIQQHDSSTRDLVLALGSNQQAILDLLHERPAEPVGKV
jgi:hypothetical protein